MKKIKNLLLTCFGLGPLQMSDSEEFESQRLQLGNEALTFKKHFVAVKPVIIHALFLS